MNQEQSVKIPVSFLEKAEGLVSKLQAAPQGAALVRTRGDVIRLALAIGLEELSVQDKNPFDLHPQRPQS